MTEKTQQSTDQTTPTKEQLIAFLQEQIEVKEFQATLQKLNTSIAVERAAELEAFIKINHFTTQQPDVVQHVITQEDIDNNPVLAEQNIKVGDTVGIPKDAYENFLHPQKESTKASTQATEPTLSVVK